MLDVHSLARARTLDIPQRPQLASSSKVKHHSSVPVYEQEFWTSRQRQASSIHEVSYRACFKPQLPAFFIATPCAKLCRCVIICGKNMPTAARMPLIAGSAWLRPIG